MPITRSAAVLQDNLKSTLHELKQCKAINEQLLIEREESEKEVLLIVNKQKNMKGEMTELHNQLLDVTGDRDRLQCLVDSFDRDGSALEVALGRITTLEKELRDARDEICLLHTTIDSLKTAQTQALFEELVPPPVAPVISPTDQQPTVTIDLTCDSPKNCLKSVTTMSCSKNKLKKYVRLNNYIKKTQKLVNKNKILCKNVNCSKERVELINEIENCRFSLEKNTEKYECDTRRLQSEMIILNSSLESISRKYESAQKEIKEHVSAVDSLLEISKYNYDTFISLTNNHNCDCKRTPPDCSAPAVCPAATDQLADQLTQAPSVDSGTDTDNVDKSPSFSQTKYVMYSDDLGKGMGLQLGRQRVGQEIINNCMPGATYIQILNKVLSSRFLEPTTLIILIGRRENTCKKDIIRYFSQLNSLQNVIKVILFSFPFSQTLSQEENNKRYNCNMIMHTLTCRHSDKFHLIDTNIFIGKYFYLTNDRYRLSKFYMRQIAELLSYYILNSVNFLTNGVAASIEQENNNDMYPLESVPSNLN